MIAKLKISYHCQVIPKNRIGDVSYEFLSHLVNALSWLERDVFSFVIDPKLSQKHSPDYKDPFGYPTGSMLIGRKQKKYKIKI